MSQSLYDTLTYHSEDFDIFQSHVPEEQDETYPVLWRRNTPPPNNKYAPAYLRFMDKHINKAKCYRGIIKDFLYAFSQADLEFRLQWSEENGSISTELENIPECTRRYDMFNRHIWN
jgi:hypothetical protein